MEGMHLIGDPALSAGAIVLDVLFQFNSSCSTPRERRTWSWLAWLYAAVILLSTPGHAQTAGCTTDLSEVAALISIFTGFREAVPGWNTSQDPCRPGWGGVVCQSRGTTCSTTVLGLQLTNLKLQGSLSSSIGNLKNLTILNIAGNPDIGGKLPDTIGSLTNLVILDFHDNGFNGSIPSTFGNLRNLQLLDLSANYLNGTIPRWLGGLKQLQRLDLSSNLLSGDLPVGASGLNNLTYAVQLSFSNNNLSGNLPDLSTLYSLQLLNASSNHFIGAVPSSLVSLKEITVLDLSSNQLTEIPNTRLTSLQLLYMANNNLTGEFPSLILNSSNLQIVNFDQNNFGTLNLPRLDDRVSRLQLISLVNNNIADVSFPNASLLSGSSLRSSDLLFLGGNPYCRDPQTGLELQVCRFNSKQILIRESGTNRKLIPIISSVAAFFILLASIVSFMVIRRLSKKSLPLEFLKSEVQPNLYSYSELRAATQDFHPDNILGRGGFGIVYKAVLPDGIELAVKQLSNSEQVLTEFLNEIITITGVRHRNLVKLKGCCVKGDQRILVYEYVENKNLAEALWDSPTKSGFELDWPRRFKIIVGISRGLAYLHEEVHPPIIHRDIKAANILLDKDRNPKIGDFGLALLFPRLDNDRTHLSVNIAGTKGYLSPEYASFGQVSEKADVFSFGILILEIISGRKNIDLTLPAEQRYILEWAWKLYEGGSLSEFIDERLMDKSREEDIKRVIKIGLACVQYAAARRPTMSSVVSMLLGHQAIETVNRENELSKGEIESLFASIQSSALTPVDEDSPLLVGLPTASASGAFIELGKLKPR